MTDFDSAALGKGDGFDAYRGLYQGGSDVAMTGPNFRARVAAQRLGRLVMVDRQLDDVRHARDAARVQSDGFEHFTLQLLRAGRLKVETPERQLVMHPGQLIVFDLTRPQRTWAEGADYLTFSVPRDMVEAATIRSLALHGTLLGPHGDLLADLMQSLMAWRIGERGGLDGPAMRMFQQGLEIALSVNAQTSVTEDALMRARLVIEQMLPTRGLEPAHIARAANLSRPTLYELFRPWGGVSRYIQARRAARLRSLLGRRENRGRSIASLSYEAGFAAESHASRLYKALYGETPGARRQRLLETEPWRETPTEHTLDAWIRSAVR